MNKQTAKISTSGTAIVSRPRRSIGSQRQLRFL